MHCHPEICFCWCLAFLLGGSPVFWILSTPSSFLVYFLVLVGTILLWLNEDQKVVHRQKSWGWQSSVFWSPGDAPPIWTGYSVCWGSLFLTIPKIPLLLSCFWILCLPCSSPCFYAAHPPMVHWGKTHRRWMVGDRHVWNILIPPPRWIDGLDMEMWVGNQFPLELWRRQPMLLFSRLEPFPDLWTCPSLHHSQDAKLFYPHKAIPHAASSRSNSPPLPTPLPSLLAPRKHYFIFLLYDFVISVYYTKGIK